MNENDTLTDFERAEQYKKLYEQASKSRTFAIVVFSILCFVSGYLLAKLHYSQPFKNLF